MVVSSESAAAQTSSMGSAHEYWFQDGSLSQVLAPTQASFRRRLDLVIRHENAAAEVASTKEGLLRQIEDARHRQVSQKMATGLFRRASAAHNQYVFDRETGSKRKRKWVQENAEVLLIFVEKFSKVIDAVATAGGPCGEVAYQTLSIMLAVFRNKVDNDNKVVTLLGEIRNALPRLENWDIIYPTKTMKGLVVRVYEKITEFSMLAAEYFSHFRKRHMLAWFSWFVNDFDGIGAEVRTTLADINNEAMYGLHQRTSTSGKHIEMLLTQNRELVVQGEEAERTRRRLLSQNEALKRELEQQRRRAELRDKQEDERRLRDFVEFLEVPLDHPGTSVVATKEALMQVFPDMPLNPPQIPHTGYMQASRSLLYGSEEYRRWHDAEEPSLLFLSGGTAWYGRKEPGLLHCWLSPFSIYLAEDLAREPNAVVAFFSGLPDLFAEPVPASTVLASIILQLLQQAPQMLRGRDHEFRRVLQRVAAADGNSWSMDSLADLLGRVLSQLGVDDSGETTTPGKTTVYVVIDRLDLCTPERHLPKAMASLLGTLTALRRPPVGVKLAVVAEASEGNAEWRSRSLPELEFDPRRLVARRDWDQQRLLSHHAATAAARPQIWDPAAHSGSGGEEEAPSDAFFF